MSKNVIDAELRITGTSNTAKVFDQMVKDAKRGTDALKKAADYDAIVAKIKPLQTALDGVAKTSARAGAQIAADASKAAKEYGRLKGALDLSEPLKRSLAQMQLSQQQVGRLLKDAGRMQRDREAALSGIGNPKIRAQVMAADTANVERQLRERARLMKVENDLANQIARQSAEHRARFAGRLYMDPADARTYRERTTFSGRMERQRAALEKAEQADLRRADAVAIANGRKQIAFASRMAKQRQAEERQIAAQELRAARELAREAVAAEKAAAREATQAAREAAQAKRQAAQERMRAARDAARTAREAARVEAAALREAARETARAERDARRQERRQHAYEHRLGHLGRGAVAGLGLGYGAHQVGHLGRETIEKGSDYLREQTRGYLAGMDPAMQAEANHMADQYQSAFPSIGRVQILEHVRALRGTFGDHGDLHHTAAALPDILKAQVVLGTMRGNDRASEDLDQLVKGLEAGGLAGDPAKFRRMLDAFLKASSLFGNTITGAGFRQYMTKAKSSKYGLSEEYLASVVPTMMQHDGAEAFGTMQRQAFQALIGDRQTKSATAAQIKFGIRDKKGKLIDEEGFVADPYKWAKDHIMPELGRRKIDLQGMGREKGAILLTRLFSAPNAGEFFASLLMNQGVIDKDRENLKTAKGREAASEIREKDPFTSLEGVKQSIIRFAEDISSPLIKDAPAYMNAFTDALNHVSGWMEKHPQETKTGAGIAAVAAASTLPLIVGHSMKALAGEGTGIIANGLRLGGGALTGLGVPMLALGAGAGFAGYATAQEYGKTFRERGPGSFDPATGTTLDGNPMSGLAPDHPWVAEAIKTWWTKTMPTWAGGAEETGKQVGENLGKAIVNAPLPPQRPTMLDDFRTKADETGTEAGKSLLQRIIESVGAGINIPINFVPGDGGGMGGGSGIQKASFGGGGGFNGLIQRASLGGGSGASRFEGAGSGLGGGGSGVAHARGVLARAHPEMVAYIRESAIRNGIDPDIALRIAASEGLGGSIPGVRNTPGDRGTSFGPFQLHYGGRGSLGTEYTRATGHHASDPTYWKEQIDFALGYAGRKRTWAPWFGRGPAGVGTRQGFGYRAPPGPTPAERAAALEPRLVRGADGREGLDLGNGTMKMPDGSIRPIPSAMPPVPAPPAGGVGTSSGGGIGSHVEAFGRHVDRLADMGFDGKIQVAVSGGGGVRATGMRVRGRGGMNVDMGISMPGAKEDASDWS